MTETKQILIIGSGHLAVQVKKLLRKRGFEVTAIFSDSSQIGSFDMLKDALEQAGIRNSKAVFAVDDQDAHNIQFALAAISLNDTLPVIVSLFNENIGPHLGATHKNLFILNPALIAAPKFVESLEKSLEHELRYELPKLVARKEHSHFDRMLVGVIAAFATLWISASLILYYTEKQPFLDAFYFVTGTMATVEYATIDLPAANDARKIFGIFLMVASQVLITTTFALIVDRLMKKRSELALGIKHYHLRDHVIVCGLGRIGYQVTEELLKRDYDVLVIESDEDNRFIELVRQHGARVYIGDAALSRVLQNAGAQKAFAVISVISNDLKNLEVGMNARSIKPGLRLVLRVFDRDVADEIKERLDINLALSTSAIAAEKFVELLDKTSSL